MIGNIDTRNGNKMVTVLNFLLFFSYANLNCSYIKYDEYKDLL